MITASLLKKDSLLRGECVCEGVRCVCDGVRGACV